MGIEQNPDSLIRVERDDEYGRPVFVSELKDKATGVTRRVEKYILSNDGHTLEVQKDTFPLLGLARTISRSSHLSGEDLPSQYLSEGLEEEIRITKIGGTSDIFRISATKHNEGEAMRVESLSFAKSLWNGVECRIYYDGDGNINEICISPDVDVVKEGEEFDMVRISLLEKDSESFEVIDNNQPLGQDIKETAEIKFHGLDVFGDPKNALWVSEEFGSDDFLCELTVFKNTILLEIEDLHTRNRRAASFSQRTDVDELYTIVSTEDFTGWEKVLERMNDHFLIS